ncbi:uncharacterized protein LOC130298351 isoform X2 [Hyla sarda]|uniref:uncharacterized protein LOC130298351 isoform X2 n=1 Tax=Hyla sarda TaxID=327740 RepID=UPI0024C3FF92|nr:uncharacterized protein LOC130298351 isoform X2 [Hyla sarda]
MDGAQKTQQGEREDVDSSVHSSIPRTQLYPSPPPALSRQDLIHHGAVACLHGVNTERGRGGGGRKCHLTPAGTTALMSTHGGSDAEEELANPERRAAGEAVIRRREPGADLAGPSTALDDRSAAGGSRERTPRPAAAGASASGQPGRDPCLVWIFGHSYVRRGAIRAAVRRDGRQLGFSRDLAVLRWIGIGGMLWCGVLPEVQFNASLDRHPDILVVHAGGNDLGLRSSRELIRDIKLDILRLKSTFPGLLFVWSDMVARRVWRHARSVDRLNKARVKLNKEVGRFVRRNGGIVVRHTDLEGEPWEFLDPDGIHLNDIGMDLWALALQGGIELALRVWRDEGQ